MTDYQEEFQRDYDDWLIDIANGWLAGKTDRSYRRMLKQLHSREFTWTIDMDENRAEDGVDYRLRFAEVQGCTYRDIYLYLVKPCSVLEMMVALATRCEEQFMGNPDQGLMPDRWFREMIDSMHLYRMNDSAYRKEAVEVAINRMLNRTYEPNGDGGLFQLMNPWADLTTVEIWYQMAWYLNEHP